MLDAIRKVLRFRVAGWWSLLVIVTVGASNAFAQAANSGGGGIPANERASQTGGFGAWLLSSLFESGSLTNMPADMGIIGAVIQPFSLVCAMVVVFVMMFKGVQHVLIAAQAKDIESSPVSMTWAPMHIVFAVALAIPIPQSGYSIGQYVAIWIAEQSNLLGNITSERVVDTSNYGLVTDIPLPGVRSAVQGMVDAHVCRVMINAMGQYTQSQNGALLSVSPRAISDSDTIDKLASPANGKDPNRLAVAYELTRSGSAGQFVNADRDGMDYCGSVIVEYDAFFQDDQDWTRPTEDAPDGSGGECAGSIMCGIGDYERNADKKRVAAAFEPAHRQIASAFITRAAGATGGIGIAASKLTYDVGAYFDSLTDPEKMEDYRELQREEGKKVAEAAQAVVTEMDTMQTEVYSAYQTAIEQLRSQNAATGDTHRDAVMRTGWTVLGLYWFQQNRYNSALLDSVSFHARPQINKDQIIGIMEAATGDSKFANRMGNRLDEYRRVVNQKIMNTRHDPNPLQYAADGTKASSATKPAEEQIRASKMREELPVYLQSILSSNMESQGAVMGDSDVPGVDVISTVFRKWVFAPITQQLVDEDMVTSLVNTGHTLVTISGIFYGIELLARSTTDWAQGKSEQGLTSDIANLITNPTDVVAGKAASGWLTSWPAVVLVNLLNDMKPLFMYLFLLGLFLAFYLPAVIMIQWLIGLVQWMVYVIEAVVVIPLWAILFASDMGQKAFAPQTAQQGLIHLLSILFYPALLVIGFTIGMKVLDVVGTFMIDYIMIGFLGMTTGFMFGPVSVVAGLTIVGIVAYQVIMRIFSGMLELNDRAIAWVGQRQTFGENNVEQAARSGIVGVIQRGEGVGQKNAANRQGGGQRPGADNRPGTPGGPGGSGRGSF